MSGSDDRTAWIVEKTRYQHIRLDTVIVGVVCGTLGGPNQVPDMLRIQQDQRERLHGARNRSAECDFKSLEYQGFEIRFRGFISSSMHAFALVEVRTQ